ncbi:MAG TPA: type I restriction endonuclease subunit R [Gelria sp.]|jgi:type I restriction enzyme R subunit|nr:type I restriction endonuclease subunit R [Gelria sp.]
MPFTEQVYENAIIELIRDKLGYEYLYGPDVTRDYHSPLYDEMLAFSLAAINPTLSQDAINEAIFKLKNYDSVQLVQKNKVFMDYLQNGIEVSTLHNGEPQYDRVKLIDYDNPHLNSYTVINQWTVIENEQRRPDVVIFINGLPLVVVELKSCSREETDASAAYRQLRNYMQDIPSLFVYNAFCIMSDLATSKAGTITANEDRYMEWKTTDGDYEETKYATFDVLFEGMLEKRRLLDIIKNFMVFSDDVKILAGYHQYFAVKKAIERSIIATATDGKGGVVWHTQGSGKSLSMVFYTKLLQEALQSPTVVVLTDRNDLDDQLFNQFAKCADYLRQVPEQAENRADLKKRLAGRVANGIIFTTMQKFEESTEPLSDRKNIIVIADEAHRSQYSLGEKIDAKTGKVTVGFARLVRGSLPNATFIGFTGTPISLKDRSTIEVFGDYIDVYDMTQSVEDGATRPVYYESRVINLGLDQEVLKSIDTEYDIVAEQAEPYIVEKSKKTLAKMDAILGADTTIQTLCQDMVTHYEDRQDILTGKAMIVAYSRPIAMKIYEELMRLRPEWSEKLKVVMTGNNDDPEEWKTVTGNKAYRMELARKFKDDQDEMKIAIVVDMWLTGFDVPSLATMYIYKPMQGHNLMQAIARVNRVFGDKEGGLIADYVGIAAALKEAMNDYTVRDRNNYGDTDISKSALPKFIEKLQVCKDLFHPFDLSPFLEGSDLDRATTIVEGINFIIANQEKKELFIREALYLRQAASLCRSLLDKTQRFEAAFFEAVRTALTRIVTEKKLSLKEINARINELLKQSIKSEGVINLFSDVDTKYSLFDPAFLEDIANMQQKNLAAELLKKLIQEQISVYKRTNVVKSELFSEKMARLMNSYVNGQINNAVVIEELLKMAAAIAKDHNAGEELGLTVEEKAFYDALLKPAAIKDFYSNEALIQITKELTDMLRKNRTIDWQKKEQARAEMRSMVRRLLKKYKYPPEGQEEALNTVIAQCEMWAG